MPLEPADRCWCGCSLLQGVHILAIYTTVLGVFSFVSLLTGPPPIEQHGHGDHGDHGDGAASSGAVPVSDTAAALKAVTTVVGTFGLVAGMKGIVGVAFRDPGRVRVLFAYHCILLLQSSIMIIFRLTEICDILEKEKKEGKFGEKGKHLDCSTAQMVLIMEFTIHTMVFGYFTFIIWSLAKKLEDARSDIAAGRSFEDHEDSFGPLGLSGGGVGGRFRLWGSPFDGPFGPVSAPSSLQQQMPLNRPYSESTAFTGEPRHIEEPQVGARRAPAPAPVQPFSGTAYRIE